MELTLKIYLERCSVGEAPATFLIFLIYVNIVHVYKHSNAEDNVEFKWEGNVTPLA